MSMENERFYRNLFRADGLRFFRACVEQTDLYIGAEKDLEQEAVKAVKKYRDELESYIRMNPVFLSSLVPIEPSAEAPLIVRDMCSAAHMAGVGPMAAVAGAVAKFVGQELMNYTNDIIVENGGDIFIKSRKDRNIGIYAGNSPLSNKLSVKLDASMTPCGVCTSSGTVGHSLSLGRADAALVIHRDSSVADACATALGNMVLSPSDIEKALNNIFKVPGVMGALVIIGESLGALGDIELV